MCDGIVEIFKCTRLGVVWFDFFEGGVWFLCNS